VQHIAILGAGELGGAAAHALARRDVARRITLIDERGSVAAGKALDIAQAAPVEAFATQLTGANDVSAAAGADLVVIADRDKAGEWTGDIGFILLKRIAEMARGAILVCAGASGRELVDRAVRDVNMPRLRVIGSAPEALVGGARAMVALALNGSPRDVSLSLLGIPPAHMVIPWGDATVGGFALTRQLNEPTRRRLHEKISALWPPGPFALAAAATHVVASIDGRSRQLACCFVAPDAGGAARARTSTVPVRLGPAGIADVLYPALTTAEQVAVDNAVQL
jgi:malate dehydrogenase